VAQIPFVPAGRMHLHGVWSLQLAICLFCSTQPETAAC
jgi:hypothetical protein